MKKTAIALAVFAAALFAVSCQKETTPEQKSGPMTISAVSEGIGADVKADLAYKYDVIWKMGDEICVRNSQKSVRFTLVAGEGTTKGTFSSTGGDISGEVEGFYPASVANLIWPAEQQNNQVPPMYCKKTLSSTQNQTFNFASLGSVLQLAFNSTIPNIVVKNVKVSADEPMSGAFTVTGGKAVITEPAEGGKPGAITLDLGEGVAMGISSKYFNIAIPSGTYSSLTIVLTATTGDKCTIQAKKVLTIEHNTVNKLTISGKFNYPDAVGTAKANIGGVEKDVQWIQLWDGGPKFAKYNVGVTDGKAESYGGYYCWGKTKDKDSEGEYKSGSEVLSGTDDTATNLWGEKWRMPTKEELLALTSPDNCRCSFTYDYEGTGVNGFLCKGKGIYSSNSVFLPAAGTFNGKMSNPNERFSYWSSTPQNDMAYALSLGKSGAYDVAPMFRKYSFSIRAVLAE